METSLTLRVSHAVTTCDSLGRESKEFHEVRNTKHRTGE